MKPAIKRTSTAHSDLADPYATAFTVVVISSLLVVASVIFMFLFPDARLTITLMHTFHEWDTLKQVLLDATSYLPASNPPSLAHARFSPMRNTLADYQDLVSRGLLTEADLLNASAASEDQWKTDPSLLQRLMVASWCAYPNARPGSTPTTRTTGCACIAARYLEFVRASANMTSNVSLAVRETFSGKVLSCIDQRQVSKTTTCGRSCSLHPMALMLYANELLLLISVTYLVFTSASIRKILSSDPDRETFAQLVLKGGVIVLGLGMLFPFILDDWKGNLLNMGGLVLAIVNLVYSLHEDLNTPLYHNHIRNTEQPNVQTPSPHPLVACIMVNLQLLLPVYTILLGMSGFGRDTWAILTFAFVGGLIGLVLQRYLWAYWYSPEGLVQYETLKILGFTFACLFIQLGLLLLGYWNHYSPAATGHLGSYILLMLFMVGMAAMVNGDREDFVTLNKEKTPPITSSPSPWPCSSSCPWDSILFSL